MQINSRSLRLGANRRAEITDELVKASPMMVQLLVSRHTVNRCLNHQGCSVVTKAGVL